MDSTCVICIAEVIFALLQEPDLNEALRDLKSEILSISSIQVCYLNRVIGDFGFFSNLHQFNLIVFILNVVCAWRCTAMLSLNGSNIKLHSFVHDTP